MSLSVVGMGIWTLEFVSVSGNVLKKEEVEATSEDEAALWAEVPAGTWTIRTSPDREYNVEWNSCGELMGVSKPGTRRMGTAFFDSFYPALENVAKGKNLGGAYERSILKHKEKVADTLGVPCFSHEGESSKE